MSDEAEGQVRVLGSFKVCVHGVGTVTLPKTDETNESEDEE